MKYQVYNQDCITGMRAHVKSQSVDLIFTDPPYGIQGDTLDRHYNRDDSLVVPGYQDVPQSEYAEFSKNWISECARVLRPGGSIYIVSGYTNLHLILCALHETDLQEVNHLIAQYSFGVSTTRKFVSSHYHMLFWQKPGSGKQKRTFHTQARFPDSKQSYHDRQSVQKLPRAYKPGQVRNRNQLNPDFVQKFIAYSSSPGDLVLDCFAGSMSTAKAALSLQRRFLGFEINAAAYAAFLPELKNL